MSDGCRSESIRFWAAIRFYASVSGRCFVELMVLCGSCSDRRTVWARGACSTQGGRYGDRAVLVTPRTPVRAPAGRLSQIGSNGGAAVASARSPGKLASSE